MQFIINVKEALKGVKTYLVAASTIIGALILFADGTIDVVGLFQSITSALLASTVRAGVASSTENK